MIPVPPSKTNLPRTVTVELGERAYDVMIGPGLLNDLGVLMKLRGLRGPVAVITDDKVGPIHANKVQRGLRQAELENFRLTVRAGETSKTMTQVTRLLGRLARRKVPRSGTIIALGGGVVGDLAGFVAASYLRGIHLVQAPTTLLGMVDSAIGGKTGVNLPEGKNLVGAFHQPRLVVADLEALKTLPAREFSAGMAEVVKYGAIADDKLLEKVAPGIHPLTPDLGKIIARCVKIKARIVEKDEFETGKRRALLNFGHTLGHAIEKATQYKTYLHGEAVAIGMRAAIRLSERQSGLNPDEAWQIAVALAANHLPTQLLPQVDRQAILEALGNDKKIGTDGKNQWVLISNLGEASVGWEIPAKEVEKVVDELYNPIPPKLDDAVPPEHA